MFRKVIGALIRPVRVLAGKFVIPPAEESYVGNNGCVHTAAAFVTWNQVEGDYLEFGVAEGNSFIAAYRAMIGGRKMHATLGYDGANYQRWQENAPRFFAFDSFEGLPPGPGERHVDYFAGSYRCSEDRFKGNLAKAGVDLRQVGTIPGFYDKSLTPETKNRLKLRRAAIVMIDCDLYESTVPVLDFLSDLVGQGTVLIFHDWFRFQGRPDHGEQRACKEWLDRNPQFELIEYWREGPQAVSFLVNLR